MKISEVTITKFRSIKKAKFNMGDITAVVGENNAGKTSILRALNSVFNFEDEKQYYENKKHQFAPKTQTHIEVTLEDIPGDNDVLNSYIYDDKIKIKFSYIYAKNKRKLQYYSSGEFKTITDVHAFMDEISKCLSYVYISAERTNRDISWGSESVFSKLIISYLDKHTRNRDRISSNIKKSSKRIHDLALVRLEKQLSQLYMQNKDLNFRIDFSHDIDYSSILNYLTLSIEDSSLSHLLEDWGSGTKSLTIIAMHRALAFIEEKDIILGIEEPEINLHPQSQKKFIQSLSGGMLDSEVQTIFTTHSTVLIDELKHENILLVRRTLDNSRGFISSVKQIPENFLEKYQINEFSHYNFFYLRNSDFFFSKYVIICESSVDLHVIKQLIEPEIKEKAADVAFIALDGVDGLIYPYFLLKELNIPFSVVVDYDFFFDYKNSNQIDKSRDKNGFPEYSREVTDIRSRRRIIDDFLQKEVCKLSSVNGYRNFFNLLKPFNFHPMRFSLDVDLICSSRAREIYFDIFHVRDDQRKTSVLLIQNKKAIKNLKHILRVMEGLSPRDYPESFKKIKNAIIERIDCEIK